MKLDNLEVGQVVKNYEELCDILGLKRTTGAAKQRQMSWIEDYVSYEKDGYKFIINEISSEEVVPLADGRRKFKEVEGLNIPREHWDSIGVYRIVESNRVYIGSTTAGFRGRFLQHVSYGGNTPVTKGMMSKGGVFEILTVMNGESEEQIRKKEREFIRLYSKTKTMNVTNTRNTKKLKKKVKKRRITINIEERHYDLLMKKLDEFYEEVEGGSVIEL